MFFLMLLFGGTLTITLLVWCVYQIVVLNILEFRAYRARRENQLMINEILKKRKQKNESRKEK